MEVCREECEPAEGAAGFFFTGFFIFFFFLLAAVQPEKELDDPWMFPAES